MAEQLHCRVDSDAVDGPHVSGALPQHGEIGCGATDTGVTKEVLGFRERVLRANTNYLQNVFVVLSKLLNVGRMAPTGRSMGGPVPEKHRSVTGDNVAEIGNTAIGRVEQLRRGEIAS